MDKPKIHCLFDKYLDIFWHHHFLDDLLVYCDDMNVPNDADGDHHCNCDDNCFDYD